MMKKTIITCLSKINQIYNIGVNRKYGDNYIVLGTRWITETDHLCFNITEIGHMIVPDWYNMILDYTRKYSKNSVFQWK